MKITSYFENHSVILYQISLPILPHALQQIKHTNSGDLYDLHFVSTTTYQWPI